MVSAIGAGIGASNIGQIINTVQRTAGPGASGANPSSQSQSGGQSQDNVTQNQETPATNRVQAVPPSSDNGAASDPTGQGLTPEEQQQVRELQQRDQEVRAHEQAHATVGGPYASAPRYDTVTGPDGRQYAVSGEVTIDASPIPGNPEATIRKLEIVVRAALAPAEPSPQDRQVAQQARQGILQARLELAQQREAERREEDGDNQTPLEEIQDQATNPTADIQNALDNFRRAEQAAETGQNRPILTNDNESDSVDISDEAAEIISALFGSA